MLLEDFHPSIASRVPEAAPQVIADALRQALSTFCRLSTAWRMKLGATQLVSGKASYDLSGKADAPICAITSVRIKGSQAIVPSITEQELDATEPGWRTATGLLPVRYLAPDRADMLRAYPIPNDDASEALDIQVAMFPNKDTTELPDALCEMYFDDIVAGAVGVLQAMPRKAWTDMTSSANADFTLRSAARVARVRSEKSNTRTKQTAITTSFDDL